MPGESGYTSLLLPALVALLAWYLLRKRSKNSLPYPPGPKGYPLIGNLLDFPLGVPLWEGLEEMAKQHATDVLRLKLPGMNMVVLSTSEAISDLLDQRSAIYSDKPSTPMIEFRLDLLPFHDAEWEPLNSTWLPYGPRWRTHRKLFNDFINLSTVDVYDANQVKVVSNFLVNLHQNPEAFKEHIRLLTGSISYGIQADTSDNEFFRMYKETLDAMSDALVPGAFLVDILPFLKHLPSWLPGVRFHVCAKKVKRDLHTAQTRPVEHVAEQLKLGSIIDTSMTSVCLENLEALSEKGVDMEVIYNTVSVVYAGMSETTNSTLGSFFLAMAWNTDVMKTAQRHLDDVLGGERLPDHSDIDDLPYITAIEHDVYLGMFMPGGTMMLENIWAICYDESAYPEPHAYNPARFLDKSGRIDPSVKALEVRVFDSGRRICPGRHLAVRMLCLTIARILTTFDILPPVDDSGRPRIPEVRYNKSIGHTMPFQCVVKPRSEKAVKLIYDAVNEG